MRNPGSKDTGRGLRQAATSPWRAFKKAHELLCPTEVNVAFTNALLLSQYFILRSGLDFIST